MNKRKPFADCRNPAPRAPKATDAHPAQPGPIVFDQIKKASHYNWHPAGECKDWMKHFPVHVAIALGYMYRHEFKGTPEQDLRKAIRHLEYALEEIQEAPRARQLRADAMAHQHAVVND